MVEGCQPVKSKDGKQKRAAKKLKNLRKKLDKTKAKLRKTRKALKVEKDGHKATVQYFHIKSRHDGATIKSLSDSISSYNRALESQTVALFPKNNINFGKQLLPCEHVNAKDGKQCGKFGRFNEASGTHRCLLHIAVKASQDNDPKTFKPIAKVVTSMNLQAETVKSTPLKITTKDTVTVSISDEEPVNNNNNNNNRKEHVSLMEECLEELNKKEKIIVEKDQIIKDQVNMIEKQKETISGFMDTVDRLTQEVGELNRVQKDLRVTLNYRDEEKDECVETIEEQVKEISTLKKTVKDAEKIISSYLNELRKAGVTIIGLEGQRIDQDKTVESLKRENEEQKKHIADAESRSSERPGKVLFGNSIEVSPWAEKEIEKLQQLVTDKINLLQESDVEIKNLIEAGQVKANELADCKQTIREQEALVIQLKGYLNNVPDDEQTKEIGVYKKKLAEYRDRLRAQNNYTEELIEEVQLETKMISELRKEKQDNARIIEELNLRMNELKKLIYEDSENLKTKDGLIEEFKKTIYALKKDLAEKDVVLYNLNKKVKDQEANIADKEKTRISYENVMREQKERIESLEKTTGWVSLQDEINKLKKTNEELSKTIGEQNGTIFELERASVNNKEKTEEIVRLNDAIRLQRKLIADNHENMIKKNAVIEDQAKIVTTLKKENKGQKREIKEKTEIILTYMKTAGDKKKTIEENLVEFEGQSEKLKAQTEKLQESERVCGNVKFALDQRNEEIAQKDQVMKAFKETFETQNRKISNLKADLANAGAVIEFYEKLQEKGK
jgi:chromosome segregation ATPase